MKNIFRQNFIKSSEGNKNKKYYYVQQNFLTFELIYQFKEPIQMLFSKIPSKYFCTNIFKHDRNYKHVLQDFQTNYHKNPVFLKNNNHQYQQYMLELITKQSIKQAALFSQFINLQYLDKWSIVTSIGKQIQIQLPNANFQKDLRYWLTLMNKFNYEPTEADTSFISYVQQQIAQNKKIHLLSYLFNLPRQNLCLGQLQAKLLKQVFGEHKKEIIQTICQGFYKQLWTKQFILQLKSACSELNSKKLQNILQLCTLSTTETTVAVSKKSLMKTATEQKIGKLLSYLDYSITKNVYINNYQIDYLLGNKYIVEYHGFSHYKSNNSKNGLQLTSKSKWKQEMLKQRGFYYCEISFMEWNRIIKNTEQRLFLINKIQNSLINQLKDPQ